MTIDADVKANELGIWNKLLIGDAAAQNRADHQHGALTTHAEVLCRLGVIDEGERTEMLELADARYSASTE